MTLLFAIVTVVMGTSLFMINRHQQTYADVVSDFVGGNYRIFENQNNIAPGSPLAADNTPATISAATPDFRMRLGLENHAAPGSSMDEWTQQDNSVQSYGTWCTRIDSSDAGDVLVMTDGVLTGWGQYWMSDDYGESWLPDDIFSSPQYIIDIDGGDRLRTADVAVSGDGSETAVLALMRYSDDIQVSIGGTMDLDTSEGGPYSGVRRTYDLGFGWDLSGYLQLAASSDLSRLAILVGNKIYYSLDGGESWTSLTDTFQCISTNIPLSCYATSIAMSGDGTTLIIGTDQENSEYAIYLIDLDTETTLDEVVLPSVGTYIQAVDISDDASHWVAINGSAVVYVDGVEAPWVDNNGYGFFGLINTIAISGNGMRFVFSASGVANSSDVVVCDVGMQACGDPQYTGMYIRDVTMSYTGSNAALTAGGSQFGYTDGYVWTYGAELLSPILQYAEKTAGTCSSQNTGWAAVTASSSIKWKTNSSVTSGTAIFGTANDPAATFGFPYAYQSYASSASGVTVLNPIDPDNSGLWDFSLTVDSGVADGTSLCLRLAQTNSNGSVTPFGAYNSYPEIAVTSAAIAQTNYRFYANADSLTPGSPRAAQNTVADVGQPGVIGQDFRLRTGIINETSNYLNSAPPSRTSLLTAIGTLAGIINTSITYDPTSLTGIETVYSNAVTVFLDPNSTSSNITSVQSALVIAIATSRLCPSGPCGTALPPVTPPVAGDAPPVVLFAPALQFAQKTAGTCAAQTTGWTAVSTASAIAYKANSTATSGSQISSYGNDPGSPTSSWAYQTYVSDSAGFATVGSIAPDAAALWDFSLVNLSTTATTNYCFRIVDGGNPLDRYDQYPEIHTGVDQYITVSSPSAINFSVNPGRMSSSNGTTNVSTNASGGYDLSLSTNAPASQADNNSLIHTTTSTLTIPSLAGSATPGSQAGLTGGTSRWGFRANYTGSLFGFTTTIETNVAYSAYTWASVPNADNPVTIRTNPNPTDLTSIGGGNTPDSTDIWYGASTSMTQTSGAYRTIVTYTAVANT